MSKYKEKIESIKQATIPAELIKDYTDPQEFYTALDSSCKDITDLLTEIRSDLAKQLNLQETHPSILAHQSYILNAEILQPIARVRRDAILSHGNNFDLVAVDNTGANRTFYAIEGDLQPDLSNVFIGYTQRLDPRTKTADGIGPLGGLCERVKAEDFDAITTNLDQFITNKIQQDPAINPTLKTDLITRTLSSLETKKRYIESKYDDVKVTITDQNIEFERMSDLTEISLRNAAREEREEASDSAGQGISAKTNKVDSAIKTLVGEAKPILAIGGINAKDDNHFLQIFRIFDLRPKWDIIKVLSPFCFTTLVDYTKLQQFRDTISSKAAKIFAKNGQEVSEFSLMPLEESLTRYGVLEDGRLSYDDNKQRDFSYRYCHEAMVPWNIAATTAKKFENHEDILLRLVEKTQQKMNENGRLYQIDFERYAQVIYKGDNRFAQLAEQIGVTEEFLRRMQEAAQAKYAERPKPVVTAQPLTPAAISTNLTAARLNQTENEGVDQSEWDEPDTESITKKTTPSSNERQNIDFNIIRDGLAKTLASRSLSTTIQPAAPTPPPTQTTSQKTGDKLRAISTPPSNEFKTRSANFAKLFEKRRDPTLTSDQENTADSQPNTTASTNTPPAPITANIPPAPLAPPPPPNFIQTTLGNNLAGITPDNKKETLDGTENKGNKSSSKNSYNIFSYKNLPYIAAGCGIIASFYYRAPATGSAILIGGLFSHSKEYLFQTNENGHYQITNMAITAKDFIKDTYSKASNSWVARVAAERTRQIGHFFGM